MAKVTRAPALPSDAASYLRRKGVRTGFSYEDVWREEHATNFTVAKMMELDLLADLQRSLAQARATGATKEEWKKEWTEKLSKRGWWGRREVVDPKTGKTVLAQLGSSRRLDTIWRVNMRMASQAGAWQRGMRSPAHRWIIYRIGPSVVHRPDHVAWDATLLPRDDPFWAVANPPNGWGCKCYTRFVSRAMRERYLRDKVPAPVIGDGQPGRVAVKTTRPELGRESYVNKRTGRTYEGYEGIDAGFERNPGTSRETQLRTSWRERDAAFAAALEPHPDSTPVRQGLDPSGAREQRGAVRAALAAIERVHGAGRLSADPKAKEVVPLPILESDTTDTPGEYRRDPRTGRPIAIDISRAGEDADRWPALLAVHEIGHYLDHAGSGYQPDPGKWESFAQRTPEMRAVIEEVMKTHQYEVIRKEDPERAWAWELWARAYAQYIAWRSGSSRLKADLDRVLTHDDEAVRARYWPYDTFAKIAVAIDRLMEERKWARRRPPATT